LFDNTIIYVQPPLEVSIVSEWGVKDMKKIILVAAGFLIICVAAIAAEWTFEYKSINAQMAVYSGGLTLPYRLRKRPKFLST
jgi:hypothetical protein